MFDDQIYKQNFGTLTPHCRLSSLIMVDLPESIFDNIGFSIKFFYSYVDDIVAMIPITQIDNLKQVFNSVRPRLEFTIEIGGNKINFFLTTINSVQKINI